MAVIFHGAELEDFAATGSWTHGTSYLGNFRRSAYARGAMKYSVYNSSNHLLGTFSGAKTTFGMTARYINADWGQVNMNMFGATDAGVFQIGVQAEVTTGYFKLVKWNGASYDDLVVGARPGNDAVRLDMYVENYGAGDATERCRVWLTYLNGSTVPNLWLDYQGDLTDGSSTSLDGLWLNNPGNSHDTSGICEVIAADEPTLRMNLVTIYPNAAGDTNTWDAGTYQSVDEMNADTGDFLESGTGGQIFGCNVTGLPAGVGYTPISVQVTNLAAKGVTGPTQLAVGIKSGGTEDYSADQALDIAYGSYKRLMPTNNPVSAAAWTVADITNLQLLSKSVT